MIERLISERGCRPVRRPFLAPRKDHEIAGLYFVGTIELIGVIEVSAKGSTIRDLASGNKIKRAGMIEKIHLTGTATGNIVDVVAECAVPAHDIATVGVFIYVQQSVSGIDDQLSSCAFVDLFGSAVGPAVISAVLDDRRIILVDLILVNNSYAGNRVALEIIRLTAVLPESQLLCPIRCIVPLCEPNVALINGIGADPVAQLIISSIDNRIIAEPQHLRYEYRSDILDVGCIPTAAICNVVFILEV